MTRVPLDSHQTAATALVVSQRIAATLSGITTVEACDNALAALKRMPSRAELERAIRSARRAAIHARRTTKAESFDIPAMPVRA